MEKRQKPAREQGASAFFSSPIIFLSANFLNPFLIPARNRNQRAGKPLKIKNTREGLKNEKIRIRIFVDVWNVVCRR